MPAFQSIRGLPRRGFPLNEQKNPNLLISGLIVSEPKWGRIKLIEDWITQKFAFLRFTFLLLPQKWDLGWSSNQVKGTIGNCCGSLYTRPCSCWAEAGVECSPTETAALGSIPSVDWNFCSFHSDFLLKFYHGCRAFLSFCKMQKTQQLKLKTFL